MRLSTLSLVWRTRPRCRGKTRRDFLDFVVDGRSLFDALGLDDKIGVLGWEVIEREHTEQLLLRQPSGLPTGRVPLYVCPECGDLDCGTVAARVEERGGAVVWSDFTHEVTYDVGDGHGTVQGRYEGAGPFAFDDETYRAVLVDRPARPAS